MNLSMVPSLQRSKSMQNKQNSWVRFSLLQWVDLPMHMSALEVAAAMTILHGMIRTKGRVSSDDDIAMVLRVCVYK